MCDLFSSLIIVGTLATASGEVPGRINEYNTQSIVATSSALDCKRFYVDVTAGHYEADGSRPTSMDQVEVKLKWKVW